MPLAASVAGGIKTRRSIFSRFRLKAARGYLASASSGQSEFALGDYVRLKKKAQAVPHEQAYYVLFSKSGFAPSLKLLAQDPNEHLTLVTLEEVADSVEKNFS